jgi:ABC-type dipeptide/oligopeptide/nickel transport system permease component
MNNQNHGQSARQLPPPNPETYGRHRRQVWWQILFPVILGYLLVIVVGILAALGTNSQIAQLGNISAMMVITPVLVLLILTLIILLASNIGLVKLLRVLPMYSHLVLLTIRHYAKMVQDWANNTTKPVIGVKSSWAGIKAALNRHQD